MLLQDVKGSNLLVSNDGRLMLADFGAAKKSYDSNAAGAGAQSLKGAISCFCGASFLAFNGEEVKERLISYDKMQVRYSGWHLNVSEVKNILPVRTCGALDALHLRC